MLLNGLMKAMGEAQRAIEGLDMADVSRGARAVYGAAAGLGMAAGLLDPLQGRPFGREKVVVYRLKMFPDDI